MVDTLDILHYEHRPDTDSGIYPSSMKKPIIPSDSKYSIDSGRGSIQSNVKKNLNHVIIEMPQQKFQELAETEGLNSVKRETQHFAETTTMHGPKRIFFGKKLSFIFWIFMVTASAGLLIYQIYELTHIYLSNPTVSQVSFLISDDGLDFPIVTVCNFNPIKKSNVMNMNATGDFSEHLLDYLMETNMDAAALYSSADRSELQVGDNYYQNYRATHPNFTIPSFFKEVGFVCSDLFKMCSLGGRQFDCCKYSKPILTNMGKCHSLDTSTGPKWMQKQTAVGANAGLQLIMDAHLDEQFTGDDNEENAIFSTDLENGFRYYVHDKDRVPYLSSEGISASPGNRVYSALSTNRYVLLPTRDWGNCSDSWPAPFSSKLPYTAGNCESICFAHHFNDSCGCSPSNYNIDGQFPICTPLQTLTCMDTKMVIVKDGVTEFTEPNCNQCKMECDSLVYHAYNSYGQEFSPGSLRWLKKKNLNWTTDHIKQNFLTINVFFRDLSHTEYAQVKGASMTELLSNIGGNMGMFLGMSLITIAEIILYFCKVFWIAVSKKRRQYMYEKKISEETQEKEIEDTVKSFKLFRNRPTNNSMRETRSRVQALSRSMHADTAADGNTGGHENAGFEIGVAGRY